MLIFFYNISEAQQLSACFVFFWLYLKIDLTNFKHGMVDVIYTHNHL